MYFTYVLRSDVDGMRYIGYSNNVERRLEEHNNGETPSLSHRRPLRLIYQESFSTALEAKRRERFLKSGQGREYLSKLGK